MSDKKVELEKLQTETIEQEKIILAIYGGLAAFSTTCLLVLTTMQNNSWIVITSSSLFAVSLISFSLIVFTKYHVLHKNKDIHIGHVFASEDAAKQPRKIGILSLIMGFLLLMLHISYITCLVALFTIIIASKHFFKFKKELNSMLGAREALR